MGHLKNIEGKDIWESILTKDFKGYNDKISVSQITISKPSILNRFKKMNSDKPYDKQIKPFNFMLIGSEIKNVIPCLPYSKNISGIEHQMFTDYKSGSASDLLHLPSKAYWKTLEDVLTQYVRHNDNKFDYDNEGIAHRRHINAERIRYIGKETNNLDETLITGIDDNDYIEYDNVREFYNWILMLKPKDVRDNGISERELKRKKADIRKGKKLNFKTKVNRILLSLFKSRPITR